MSKAKVIIIAAFAYETFSFLTALFYYFKPYL